MYVLSVPFTMLRPAMYCVSVVNTPILLSSISSTGGRKIEKFRDKAARPRSDAAEA